MLRTASTIFVVRRRVFASEAQEAFMEGHVEAFRVLGGVLPGAQDEHQAGIHGEHVMV